MPFSRANRGDLCGTVLDRSLQPINQLSGEHYENLTNPLRSSGLDPHAVFADDGRRYTDMGRFTTAAPSPGVCDNYRPR